MPNKVRGNIPPRIKEERGYQPRKGSKTGRVDPIGAWDRTNKTINQILNGEQAVKDGRRKTSK